MNASLKNLNIYTLRLIRNSSKKGNIKVVFELVKKQFLVVSEARGRGKCWHWEEGQLAHCRFSGPTHLWPTLNNSARYISAGPHEWWPCEGERGTEAETVRLICDAPASSVDCAHSATFFCPSDIHMGLWEGGWKHTGLKYSFKRGSFSFCLLCWKSLSYTGTFSEKK